MLPYIFCCNISPAFNFVRLYSFCFSFSWFMFAEFDVLGGGRVGGGGAVYSWDVSKLLAKVRNHHTPENIISYFPSSRIQADDLVIIYSSHVRDLKENTEYTSIKTLIFTSWPCSDFCLTIQLNWENSSGWFVCSCSSFWQMIQVFSPSIFASARACAEACYKTGCCA